MKKKIGEKIRILRLGKGYTQIYLAETLNISESTYRSIEAGKTTLDVELLFQIAQELDVRMSDVLAEGDY